VSSRSDLQYRGAMWGLVLVPLGGVAVLYLFAVIARSAGLTDGHSVSFDASLLTTLVVYALAVLLGALWLRSLYRGGFSRRWPMAAWGGLLAGMGLLAAILRWFELLPSDALLVMALALGVIVGQAVQLILLKRRSHSAEKGHDN
jgi:hypothetical protein